VNPKNKSMKGTIFLITSASNIAKKLNDGNALIIFSNFKNPIRSRIARLSLVSSACESSVSMLVPHVVCAKNDRKKKKTKRLSMMLSRS
jgi:hypothetical protein